MEFAVAPTRTGRLEVAGAGIVYAAWEDAPTGPPIVLVHGAAAHMGWWDAVIAALAPGRRLVALELSGCGDSDWREQYTGEGWADEVAAVADAVAGGSSLLVGHSLGGRVSIIAAARHPGLARELVLVDAPTRRPDGPSRRMPKPRGLRPTFDSLPEAVAAFRLRPREPVHDRALLERVAAAAYRHESEGWTLKADAGVFGQIGDDSLAAHLRRLTLPITLVFGRHSALVDADSRAFLREAHPGPTTLVGLEGHHHLTLNRAEAVAGLVAQRWAAM